MKYLGLDYSGAVCAWSCIEDGKLISYGSFDFSDIKTIPSKYEGAVLLKIYRQTLDLLIKLQPDYVLLEDIFAQSVIGYKKLAKVQGAVAVAMARYENEIPIMFKYASEVRAPYDLTLYKPDFMKAIDTNKLLSREFRARVAELKKPKKIKLSWYRKAYKFAKKYLKNATEDEFEKAKKGKVISFVNTMYGLSLTYVDNDIADSLLLAHYLYQLKTGMIIPPPKKKKKRKIKVKKTVDKLI